MAEWNLEEAIKLWNEGKSSSELAAYYGVSRNAVIGQMTRARIKGYDVHRKDNKIKNQEFKPARLRPRSEITPGMPDKADIVLHSILTLKPVLPPKKAKLMRIYDLGPNQCKYPTDELNGEHLFCGAKTDGVYCEEHYKVCYNRPVKKEQVSRRDYKNKFLRINF